MIFNLQQLRRDISNYDAKVVVISRCLAKRTIQTPFYLVIIHRTLLMDYLDVEQIFFRNYSSFNKYVFLFISILRFSQIN